MHSNTYWRCHMSWFTCCDVCLRSPRLARFTCRTSAAHQHQAPAGGPSLGNEFETHNQSLIRRRLSPAPGNTRTACTSCWRGGEWCRRASTPDRSPTSCRTPARCPFRPLAFCPTVPSKKTCCGPLHAVPAQCLRVCTLCLCPPFAESIAWCSTQLWTEPTCRQPQQRSRRCDRGALVVTDTPKL